MIRKLLRQLGFLGSSFSLLLILCCRKGDTLVIFSTLTLLASHVGTTVQLVQYLNRMFSERVIHLSHFLHLNYWQVM